MKRTEGRTKQQHTDIEDLIDILNKLEIKNNELAAEFKEIKKAVHGVANKLNNQQNNNKTKGKYNRKLEVQDITVGDEVIILNPNNDQQPEGKVTGFTATGQVRIRTKNGSIVRRRAFNLQHK
jgi:hypothetical protein